MKPSDGKERGKQSLISSGWPCSVHQPKASPSGQCNTEEKLARVKRRRTRRERNYIKFGQYVTDKAPEKKTSSRGPQKMLPPFWSSRLSSCAKSTPIKGSCVSKPVFITQNRLSQHLGMFNREVKSVDVERLLSPRNEQEEMEVTPAQIASRAEDMLLGEEIQSSTPSNAHQKPGSSERFGYSIKNQSRKSENSPLTQVLAAPALVTEQHPVTTLHAVHAGSQPSAAPTAAAFSQETEAFQSNASEVFNEKENVPPAPTAGAEPVKAKSRAKELAEDLQNLLDLKKIFPGHHLISETRQAILNILQEQKKKLPDFSSLALLKKTAGGGKSDPIDSDFKSPAKRDLVELQQESKSTDLSNTNSNQGVSLKKRRGQEQFFCISSSPSPGHTAVRMAEKRPGQREDFRSFAEPEVFDQLSVYLAAGQPYPPHPSASSQRPNAARGSIAPEKQYPGQDALLRTVPHWEQKLGDAPWAPQSRQNWSEAANRVLPKRNIPKRHCLPSAVHDSANLSMNGSGHFLLTDLQQAYVCEPSKGPWNLQENREAARHSSHPSPEPHSSQPLDLGFRTTERSASESQTSFDVLKSIWSPKATSTGAQLSVSQVSGCPHLRHKLPSSKELNFEQGQPKEFLQLFNIIPPRQCSFRRQNPRQEACVPSGHLQHDSGLFSAQANPTAPSQKFCLERGRTSKNYQFLGVTEGLGDHGFSSSGGQAHDLERLLQLEGPQQLGAFQQLPMSYFPPSEALENRNSPLCVLKSHVLGQPSPEPWAFPRMKLY